MSEETDEQQSMTPDEIRAYQNSFLKPCKPGEVRNTKGRGKGTPNTSTVIKKWLLAKEQLPDNAELPAFLKKGLKLTQLDLITLAQIKKARDGDTQSFNALLDRADGKPVQKNMLANDPENPLPEAAPRQVVILPNGQEISFE